MREARIDFAAAGGVDLDRLERCLKLRGEDERVVEALPRLLAKVRAS